MFWWGHINAIFTVLAFVSFIVSILSGMWSIFAGTLIVLFLARLAQVTINTVYTAARGRPLFYDNRIEFK